MWPKHTPACLPRSFTSLPSANRTLRTGSRFRPPLLLHHRGEPTALANAEPRSHLPACDLRGHGDRWWPGIKHQPKEAVTDSVVLSTVRCVTVPLAPGQQRSAGSTEEEASRRQPSTGFRPGPCHLLATALKKSSELRSWVSSSVTRGRKDTCCLEGLKVRTAPSMRPVPQIELRPSALDPSPAPSGRLSCLQGGRVPWALLSRA